MFMYVIIHAKDVRKDDEDVPKAKRCTKEYKIQERKEMSESTFRYKSARAVH